MRKLILAVSLAIALGGSSASADTITVTLPQFVGQIDAVNTTAVVGTFSFTIPTDQAIVAAVISGTFGNSSFNQTSAPAIVRLDNLPIAQCASDAPCTFPPGPDPFNFSISPSSLSILVDGSATLTVTQTDDGTVRLGPTTLSIQTAAVPEPATLLLLGTGLVGGAARFRRRRVAA